VTRTEGDVRRAIEAALEAFEDAIADTRISEGGPETLEVDIGCCAEAMANALCDSLACSEAQLDWRSPTRDAFHRVLPTCRETADASTEYKKIERPKTVMGGFGKALKKVKSDPISLIATAAMPFTFGLSGAAIVVRSAQNRFREDEITSAYARARRDQEWEMLVARTEILSNLLQQIPGFQESWLAIHGEVVGSPKWSPNPTGDRWKRMFGVYDTD